MADAAGAARNQSRYRDKCQLQIKRIPCCLPATRETKTMSKNVYCLKNTNKVLQIANGVMSYIIV